MKEPNGWKEERWFDYSANVKEHVMREEPPVSHALSLAEDLVRQVVMRIVTEVTNAARETIKDGGDVYAALDEAVRGAKYIIYDGYHCHLVNVWCWDYGGSLGEDGTRADATQALYEMVLSELNIDE